jgi:hypothetical protein
MGIFAWIDRLFSRHNGPADQHEHTRINPATGLPMTGTGIGGVDVAGNPFGIDLRRHDDSVASHDHNRHHDHFHTQDHYGHSATSASHDWHHHSPHDY